jgi:hypothetical protein
MLCPWVLSYGCYSRKTSTKNAESDEIPFWWRAPLLLPLLASEPELGPIWVQYKSLDAFYCATLLFRDRVQINLARDFRRGAPGAIALFLAACPQNPASSRGYGASEDAT